MTRNTNILIIGFILLSELLSAQLKVPAVYSNISVNKNNDLVLEMDTLKIIAKTIDAVYKVEDFSKAREGSNQGLVFNSGKKNLTGTMYFGLLPYGSFHDYQ